MEEYLKLLLEQIRCKKAHLHIKEELQTHMEEQIADNMEKGMDWKQAEEAAVRDMGDPVETGIALDRIHRPQTAWGMIALMAVISVAGILMHLLISGQIIEYDEGVLSGSSAFALHTAVGFLLMLIVYRIDYSVIAHFSKLIAVVIMAIGLYGLVDGSVVYGLHYIRVLGFKISLLPIMILYVPLYGAVIYKYHGTGYKGLLKSVLWMLVPVWITFKLPSLSLSMIMLVSMSVVLTVAVAKGWFLVARKRTIAAIWGIELILPALGLGAAYVFGWLRDYQIARIQAFLTNTGDANYITSLLRSILADIHLIGNSGRELIETLPAFNSDFVFSYMLSTYGILVGGIICCLLAAMVIKVFSVSFRQKNQLGMSMGCGCGMVLLLNMVISIGECLGLLPIAGTFLPFFSAGGWNIIVCYVLMGIILSIYRYKNIHTAHINTKKPIVKVMIQL